MDQIGLYLLFLSGLLSLALCKPREYILIKQNMDWGSAQKYCRTNHIDLATVQTDEDLSSMQAEENQFSGYAWIGLLRDINSWRWSYNEESLAFKSWASGQPDNYNGVEKCAAINYDGGWRDFPCTMSYRFICYDGSAKATKKMILSSTTQTWTDAQTFCRVHYTDLAIIRSQEDNDEITTMIFNSSSIFWIGLYRDYWRWSDWTSFSSSVQLAIQRFTVQSYECAGAYIYPPSFVSYSCSVAYYFWCSTDKRNRQVIRVQVEAAENVDHAKLDTLILNKFQQTLSGENVTVMWRTQPNGNVFQKKTNSEANTTLVCGALKKN